MTTKELIKAVENERGSAFQNCRECEYGTHNGEAIEKLKRLAELEDKIENGTLKFLQCKVGDIVYFIDEKKWCWEMIVAEIGILKKSIVYKIGNGRKELRYVYDEDLGKKWFLTKAEAEKRLKELQNG